MPIILLTCDGDYIIVAGFCDCYASTRGYYKIGIRSTTLSRYRGGPQFTGFVKHWYGHILALSAITPNGGWWSWCGVDDYIMIMMLSKVTWLAHCYLFWCEATVFVYLMFIWSPCGQREISGSCYIWKTRYGEWFSRLSQCLASDTKREMIDTGPAICGGDK